MLGDTRALKEGWYGLCYEPIKALKLQWVDTITGELVTIMKILKDATGDLDIYFNNYDSVELINLPCQKCIECLNDYSMEWSYRLMNECSCHKTSCVLTLTYEKTDGELNKRDLQLFLKRLRRRIEPTKIRYYACGEYGSKGLRPHFHIIIFGCPNDLVFLKKSSKGTILFDSDFIRSVWNKGFISVGNVTLESCKYSAKYLQKLNQIEEKEIQPFVCMSLKPGIGYKYALENSDEIIKEDKIYIEGHYKKTPRYYLKIYERLGYDLKKLKETRKVRSVLFERSSIDNLKRKEKLLTKLGF